VELSPAACWLIVRLQENPGADIAALCGDFDLPAAVGDRALAELRAQGLVIVSGAESGAGNGAQPDRTVTPEGQEIVERLVAERRASLARLCEGWSPDQPADLAGLLTRLANELSRQPSRGRRAGIASVAAQRSGPTGAAGQPWAPWPSSIEPAMIRDPCDRPRLRKLNAQREITTKRFW